VSRIIGFFCLCEVVSCSNCPLSAPSYATDQWIVIHRSMNSPSSGSVHWSVDIDVTCGRVGKWVWRSLQPTVSAHLITHRQLWHMDVKGLSHCVRRVNTCCVVLWSPYVIGRPYIFSSCDFYLSIFLSSFFFFPRLISAATDWISTILLHMAWP